MGSSGSKMGQHVPEEELTEGSVPSTPILTPKTVKTCDFDEMDPRSPSSTICRTPIQMVLSDEFKDCLTETPEKVFLDVDPRSPTVEFNRTPIVVPATEEDLIKKVHRRNMQNAAVPPKLLQSSPIRAKSDAHKRRSIVGVLETNVDFTETDLDAVLRQKSKSRDRIDVVKREDVDPRSPTQDFPRTPVQIVKKIGEIDLVKTEEAEDKLYIEKVEEQLNTEKVSEKLNTEKVPEKLNTEKVPEELNTEKVVEELNTEKVVEELNTEKLEELNTEKIETSRQKTKENLTIKITKECQENPEEVNKLAETVPYWKVQKINGLEQEIKLLEQQMQATVTKGDAPAGKVEFIKEIIGYLTDDLLVANEDVKPNKTKPEENKTPTTTPTLANLTSEVKDFDKKLTNLIYEDKDVVVVPRVVKLRENSRTPLGNRNSTGEITKSMLKLKVSDRPRKSEGSNKNLMPGSKIPVFREKLGKKMVQCENTPPRNLDKKLVRPKTTHWDEDASLII